jgi:AbrB family transcriptional regulator (stage V sporulation protein T)
MVSCITDHDQVVAASGTGSKEYNGKTISSELEEMITLREGSCLNAGEPGRIPVIEDQQSRIYAQTISPILCAGDAIGAVILLGKTEEDIFGDAERMLVQTAAGFLGRQMEQ